MYKILKFVGGILAGAGTLALAARGITYASRVEPTEVEVTRVTVPLRHLSPRFDGFTIAHLSDIHLGGWMTLEHMHLIADHVNDLQPDVIAITGDFVHDLWHLSPDDLTRSLNTLRANEAVVGVLGNHDHRQGAARVIAAVRAAGVTLLANQHLALTRDEATLYIAGVDDIWVNRQDLACTLDGIPPDSAIVLLAHEPDFADEVAATRRVGLQLSGHTHGGQVRIPGWGAPVLPWLGQKYDAGRFHQDGMAIYVNRGVGMIPPYIRFNCRPEITLLTLASPS
jgi:predicted MPP superfamily phosphohydrolase